jgi:REP element-mobilizing transposase RayT
MCTQSRECLFGEIANDEVMLNEYGKVVEEEWLKTPRMRTRVELDEFVVMPNHLHATIVIQEGTTTMPIVGAHSRMAGAHSSAPLHRTRKSLGSLIAGFKSAVTKRINMLRTSPGFPVWQRNYYDHVVRDEDDMNRIREYIVNNPVRWAEDENNPAMIARQRASTTILKHGEPRRSERAKSRSG